MKLPMFITIVRVPIICIIRICHESSIVVSITTFREPLGKVLVANTVCRQCAGNVWPVMDGW